MIVPAAIANNKCSITNYFLDSLPGRFRAKMSGWYRPRTCGAGSRGSASRLDPGLHARRDVTRHCRWDALLRDPAPHVSTPFSLLPWGSEHGPRQRLEPWLTTVAANFQTTSEFMALMVAATSTPSWCINPLLRLGRKRR